LLIHYLWSFLVLLSGLVLLVWSADKFVDGSAATARHYGVSPLFIGMIIVGFGTSVPEMTVSVLAAIQGNPGIAIGNAYGSNITNIALILGATALLRPVQFQSAVLRKELPVLVGVTLLTAWQVSDGELSRADAAVLLLVFAALITWTIVTNIQNRNGTVSAATESIQESGLSRRAAITWMFVGLVLIVVSSKLFVWGAVRIAGLMGVSELIIGLTIVAIGTSLPEFASSLAASRKGENDIIVGNIIGSNLFNTLVVIGLAAAVKPMHVDHEVIYRDLPTMGFLTVLLLLMGFRKRGTAQISRLNGGVLVVIYAIYMAYLLLT